MAIPGRTFICVGETGCGKSTFIKAMGGAVPPAEVLDNGSSNTTEVSLYPINTEGDSLMDGPGFGDTRKDDDQHSDAEHKKKILVKLTADRRTHVNGVFWFVSRVRGDESLIDQARFIEGLGELLKPGAIWKHVVVMIRAGTRREGVRKAVEDLTGDQSIAHSLQVRVVGLRDDELDPGQRCSVIVSKCGHQIELEKPTVDDVLGFVVSSDPFQIARRSDRCKRCHQEGDSRTFHPCHVKTEPTHCYQLKHNGFLVPCHGPRDNQEKIAHRKAAATKLLASAAKIAGSVAAGGASACAAGLTTVVPNPVTLSIAVALACTAAGLAAAATESDQYGEGQTFNHRAQPLRCAITKQKIGKATLKSPHMTDVAMRGVCLNCHENVGVTGPCRLLWTCCGDSVEHDATDLDHLGYELGIPCRPVCKGTCLSDPQAQPQGCFDRCTGCGATSDTEAFRTRGCSDGEHDLVEVDHPNHEQ